MASAANLGTYLYVALDTHVLVPGAAVTVLWAVTVSAVRGELSLDLVLTTQGVVMEHNVAIGTSGGEHGALSFVGTDVVPTVTMAGMLWTVVTTAAAGTSSGLVAEAPVTVVYASGPPRPA